MKIYDLANWCSTYGACEDALEWLVAQETVEQAWFNCKRGDWLLWLVEKSGYANERNLRLLAVAMVRETPLGDGRMVQDLLTDPRSLNALDVAERYANGESTQDELAAAWDAARDAARAAAWDAAWDAASAAAWDAASAAASAAAWDAQCDIIRQRIALDDVLGEIK